MVPLQLLLVTDILNVTESLLLLSFKNEDLRAKAQCFMYTSTNIVTLSKEMHKTHVT
jgi:hypothetical protein